MLWSYPMPLPNSLPLDCSPPPLHHPSEQSQMSEASGPFSGFGTSTQRAAPSFLKHGFRVTPGGPPALHSL